jgi:predicted ArsR family transcriptional regulator
MEHVRARADNPITSFEAADEVKSFEKLHYFKIMEVLREFGPMGKDGIAYMANLEPAQVSKRLAEMEREGWIELTGKKVKSKSGRAEREWRLLTNHQNPLKLTGL